MDNKSLEADVQKIKTACLLYFMVNLGLVILLGLLCIYLLIDYPRAYIIYMVLMGSLIYGLSWIISYRGLKKLKNWGRLLAIINSIFLIMVILILMIWTFSTKSAQAISQANSIILPWIILPIMVLIFLYKKNIREAFN